MVSSNECTVLRQARGYDWLARWYKPLEFMLFGSTLMQARLAGLAWIQSHVAPKRVLVLGDGDGRLLERILDVMPSARVTSVDFSSAMIRRQKALVARRKLQHRVTWIHTDALRWKPDACGFDVVVFAFFLDAFTSAELDQHLSGWIDGVRLGGILYYVDFVPADRVRGLFASRIARCRLAMMHVLFRIVTKLPNRQLPPIRDDLRRNVSSIEFEQTFSGGAIESVVFRCASPMNEAIRLSHE